jgi:hypothetical protein
MKSILAVFAVATTICGCSGGGGDAMALFPMQVFTAVDDSGGAFTVPIAASGAQSAMWASDAPQIATVTGDDTIGQVRAVSVGDAPIVVAAGGKTVSAMVTVSRYTAAQRAAGQVAFTAHACAGCHDSGPDISPSGVGKHSEAQLQAAFLGMNPEGGPIEGVVHNFVPDSDPASLALVAYLRSLPARGVPHADE